MVGTVKDDFYKGGFNLTMLPALDVGAGRSTDTETRLRCQLMGARARNAKLEQVIRDGLKTFDSNKKVKPSRRHEWCERALNALKVKAR